MGLNREARRGLVKRLRQMYHEPSRVEDAELIERYFASSAWRCNRYWGHVVPLARRTGHPDGTVTLDYWLLRKIDPDQPRTIDDLEALRSLLPTWESEIEPRLQQEAKRLHRTLMELPLSDLLLWGTIADRLAQWNTESESARTDLANAVIALATITRTFWFISEAVRRAPEAESLFEGFSLPVEAEAPSEDEESSNTEATKAVPPNLAEAATRLAEPVQDWGSLAGRLAELASRLAAEGPSESVLVGLSASFEEFEVLRLMQPSLETERQKVIAQIDTFERWLADLANRPALAWVKSSACPAIQHWRDRVHNATTIEIVREAQHSFLSADGIARSAVAQLEQVQTDREQFELRREGLKTALHSAGSLEERAALQKQQRLLPDEETLLQERLERHEAELISALNSPTPSPAAAAGSEPLTSDSPVMVGQGRVGPESQSSEPPARSEVGVQAVSPTAEPETLIDEGTVSVDELPPIAAAEPLIESPAVAAACRRPTPPLKSRNWFRRPMTLQAPRTNSLPTQQELSVARYGESFGAVVRGRHLCGDGAERAEPGRRCAAT